MRASRVRMAVLCLLAAIGPFLAVGVTHSRFTDQTQNSGNRIDGAPDWRPPSASRSAVQKTEGGETGYLRTLGTYRVYAEVADAGNPPSGTADVDALFPSLFSLDVDPGTFTVEGLTYNWASLVGAVPAGTPAGPYPYQLTMVDNLGHTGTSATFPATIDNTRPSTADVQTTAGGSGPGAIAGRPNAGDVVSLSYNEPIDRISILPAWTDTSASATVRIRNNVMSRDRLSVDGANLGEINLGRNDYVTADTTFTGSTLTRSGNTITVTLGALGAGTPSTAATTGAMIWTPSVAAFDRAGNLANAAAATESGAADRDF